MSKETVERFDTNYFQKKFEKYVELDDLDQAIIRMMTKFPGITRAKLARALEIAPTTVSKRLKRPAVQRVLNDYTTDNQILVADIKTKALRKIRSIIQTSNNENIVLKACMFALANEFGVGLEQTDLREKVYRVQFGESGGLYQKTIDITKDLDEHRKLKEAKPLDILAELKDVEYESTL